MMIEKSNRRINYETDHTWKHRDHGAPERFYLHLPISRVSTKWQWCSIAYEGHAFSLTRRAYSDSEVKVGEAFDGMRKKVFIATKTGAKTPEEGTGPGKNFPENLRTDYIDIYQFHCADQCYRPGDGTGMYECMEELKKEGKIRHLASHL